jgi:hypothetical protein
VSNVIHLLPEHASPPVQGPPPSLESGMKSELVAALQKNLKAWGFDPGPANGTFGASTENAVKAMQRRLGLEATGRIDKDTRSAMAADLGSAESVLRSSNLMAAPDAAPAAASAEASPIYKQPLFLAAAAGALWFLFLRRKGQSVSGASYDELGLEDLTEDDVEDPAVETESEAAPADGADNDADDKE